MLDAAKGCKQSQGTSTLPREMVRHPRQRLISDLLEPCAVKVARTVLRGEGGSDDTLLPDDQEILKLGSLQWRCRYGLQPFVKILGIKVNGHSDRPPARPPARAAPHLLLPHSLPARSPSLPSLKFLTLAWVPLRLSIGPVTAVPEKLPGHVLGDFRRVWVRIRSGAASFGPSWADVNASGVTVAVPVG